jgi:LTXXQ motif family protein
MTSKTLVLAAAALAASVTLASAQTAQDPHHPGTDAGTTAQSQPSAPPSGIARGPAQPGVMPMKPGATPGGANMMMGGDTTQMTDTMQMMRGGMMPMGVGLTGRRPFQHIEGQIAFYRTELKITDAQDPLWNAFAEALRGNATRLRQAMAMATEANGVVAVPEQMERRIAMLSALLEAMQSMQAAAKPLYATLTDEQKKVADELMIEHVMAMRARGL